MGGVKWDILENQNSDINEDMRHCEGELCKLIIKGFARHHRERDALLATAEEENHRVHCFDDITGKEHPWCEVRQAQEQELKYLRDLRVYEKVDDRDVIAKYQVTPVDTMWIGTTSLCLSYSYYLSYSLTLLLSYSLTLYLSPCRLACTLHSCTVYT